MTHPDLEELKDELERLAKKGITLDVDLQRKKFTFSVDADVFDIGIELSAEDLEAKRFPHIDWINELLLSRGWTHTFEGEVVGWTWSKKDRKARK